MEPHEGDEEFENSSSIPLPTLEENPNFSAHSNLERLILRCCKSLIEIDGSICQLKRLVSLDVSYCKSLIEIDGSICQLKCLVSLDVSCCKNLQRLPDELGKYLTSLEYLSLTHCKSLERLPNTIGNLESLIELDISATRIKELPDSIGKLKNLKVVKMLDGGINKIPDAFWAIEKLEKIKVRKEYGTEDFHVKIGNCIYMNQSLRILRLMDADICALPPRFPKSLITMELSLLYMDMFPDLSNLTNLTKLDLSFSRRYSDGESNGIVQDPIPRWIGNLTKLKSLALCFDCETALPTDPISLPPQLNSLRLQCPNLCHLPTLPSSLSSLTLCNCKSLCSMEDLSNLKKLSSLHISYAAIAEIQGLGCLENLRDLELWNLQQVEILPDLSNLKKLRSFQVENCGNLVEIQGKLPRLLDRLRISSSPSLQNLPDLSSLMSKQAVEIDYCSKLNVEAILENAWMNPRDLKLEGFNQLQILPDLSNSNELTRLTVRSCDNLVEIQGELPQSLEELEISSCGSLQQLPDLSSLKGLRRIKIDHCGKLNVEAILGFARNNPLDLQLVGLEQLQILPNLSNSDKLRHLQVENCSNLVEIRGELPQSLEKLKISCESLHKMPDLSSLKKLQWVDIEGCTKLKGEAILNSSRRSQANLWENLRYLRICGLGQVKILPDLSNSNKLRCLRVEKCGDLVEIQGELPQSLEELEISSCESLEKLPNLSSLKGLRRLSIDRCGKLNVEVNSWLCAEKLVKDHESEFDSEFEFDSESESEYEYELEGEDEE